MIHFFLTKWELPCLIARIRLKLEFNDTTNEPLHWHSIF